MLKNPKVSIIIPTYNEESDISECLKSLATQSIKNFEIIIVDDGSTDRTLEVIKNFKNENKEKIKIISGKHRGPGFSRNLGAKKAQGRILVFIDSDMTFQRDYIKNLISPILSNKKVVGTTHDYEVVKNIDNIWSRCWGRIRVSKESAHKIKIFRAIRKSIFLELGGFDPNYGYADDQSLYLKYGIKPLIASDTSCFHKNPETLKSVYKQSRWIGASIKNPIISLKFLNFLVPIFLFIISPVVIPFLSVKKSLKNDDFSILFPWIFMFMTARYFGTISGFMRKIYLGRTYR